MSGMGGSVCKWDRKAEAHVTREHRADCVSAACGGCQPCTHDDAGNPVRHCRTRLRCKSHLGWSEHTCPECLGKIRANLTAILTALALMPREAEFRGIDSEPANLAGPHADYVTAQWRLVNADRSGEIVEELDMRDPYTCLTLHERTIREDLGHDGTTLVSATIAASAGYLSWVLTDLARLEDQTIELVALLSDTARLRIHVEAALRDGRTPERGVPCPECVGAGAAPRRLERRFGHWCDDEDCEREHYLDDTADEWVCPTNHSHRWDHDAYTNYLADRRGLVG